MAAKNRTKDKTKDRAEARAAQRAERLAELERRAKAARRRRHRMVGGVVGALVVVVAIVLVLVSRSNDIEASAAGESDYGVTIGPADAPHEIVVYEDFLCPGCGQLEAATHDQLTALAEDGEVQVDYRPFVLLDRLGTYSARATSAFGVVLDTSGPEVAKRFHDLLYSDQPAEDADPYPDAQWLVDKAVEAGADEAAVTPGIEAGENDFAREATREAEAAGVDSTPTVLLDGEVFTGTPQELLDEVGQDG